MVNPLSTAVVDGGRRRLTDQAEVTFSKSAVGISTLLTRWVTQNRGHMYKILNPFIYEYCTSKK